MSGADIFLTCLLAVWAVLMAALWISHERAWKRRHGGGGTS